MADLPDLTGNNIEDTYQRLVTVESGVYYDGTGSLLNIGSSDEAESIHIAAKNTSGVTITKGTPVYITGNVGGSEKLTIAAADASDPSKMPAVGLAETDLDNNDEGFIAQGGYLKQITTNVIDGVSASPNDTVYVKAGGGLTLTKPVGSDLIQNIAKVARTHQSNGSLIVSSILRTNDVPNFISCTQITASGDISASGQFLGSNFGLGSTDKLQFSNATLQFRLNNGSRITHTPTIFRPTSDEGVSLGRSNEKWKELVVNHITASGNVSASGDINANNLILPNNGKVGVDGLDETYIEFSNNLLTITKAGGDLSLYGQTGINLGTGGTLINTQGQISSSYKATFPIITSSKVSGFVTNDGNNRILTSNGDGTFNAEQFFTVSNTTIEIQKDNIDIQSQGPLDLRGSINMIGSITASGDISASGKIIAGDILNASDPENLGLFFRNTGTEISGRLDVTQAVTATNITASGNISASGELIGIIDGGTF